MDGAERFIKVYSYPKGKHIVSGVRFDTKARARQFASLYTRRCSIIVRAQYNCCRNGDVVLDVPVKEIGATQTVRKDVSLDTWTNNVFGRIESDIKEKSDWKCAELISGSRACDVDVSLANSWEG